MSLRIVLDTNVLVSGLRSRRGASFRILQMVGDPRWRLYVSVPLALEYEDVLKRELMQSVIGPEAVDHLLDYLFSVSERIEVRVRLRPALRDPDDDRILELAAQAGATIVTFNLRDFAGAASHGVRVIPPQEFLEQLGEVK